MKPDRTILMTFLILLVVLTVSFGGSISTYLIYNFNGFMFTNGTRNMTGTLNMSWYNISNVMTNAPGDAANVSYVLEHAGGGTSDAWNSTYYLRDTSRTLTGPTIRRNVNNEYLVLYGGDATAPQGGQIQLYGGNDVTLNGGMAFAVGDAAGIFVPVMWIEGTTNTPFLSLVNHQIKDLLDPTANQDAATKIYVDTAVSGGVSSSLNDYYTNDTNKYLFGETIRRNIDNSFLAMYGGNAIAGGTGIIAAFGKNFGAHEEVAQIIGGDAAGVGNIVITGWMDGATPYMNMYGYNITGIKTITNSTDVVNKSYVDNMNASVIANLSNFAYLPGRLNGQVLNGGVNGNSESLVLNASSNNNGGMVLRLGDSNGLTNISIRNYTNGQVAYIDSTGNSFFNSTIKVGTEKSNSEATGILVSRDIGSTYGTSVHGFSDSSDITKSGVGYNSYDARVTFSGVNNINHYAAFQAAPTYSSSGTINNIYGFYSNPTINSGTVLNSYGIYLHEPTKTGGTITNNYSIVSESRAGSFGFGCVTPTAFVHIYNASGGAMIKIDGSGLTNDWRGLTLRHDNREYFVIKGNPSTGELRIGGVNSGGYFTTIYANNAEVMRVSGTNVSVGSTTLNTAQFNVADTVRFAKYASCTLGTDSGGNLTCVSDEKYKTNIQPYTGGLSKILALNPVTYNWNKESGLATNDLNVGLIANQVKTIIPEIVFSKPDITYEQIKTKDEVKDEKTGEVTQEAEYTTVEKPVLDKDGKQTTTLSISDRAIIAVQINAIKELASIVQQQNETINQQEARIAALEKKVGL